MKRAQSDEQKARRRLTILEEARAAFDAQDYRDIRLQDLADRVGLVKGTFYRYFATKQDLFMSLYAMELEEWLAEWSAKVARASGGTRAVKAARGAKAGSPAAALERIMIDTLAARPRLVRLIGSFPGDLEPALSEEGLKSYKRFLLDYLSRSAAALGPFGRRLGKRAVPFLVSVFVLIQGCAPLCFPASRIAAMLEREEEFAPFRFEFPRLFAPLARALFAAYFAEGAPGRPRRPSP